MNTVEFRRGVYDGDLLLVTPVIDGTPLTELVTAFEKSHGYNDPSGGYGGLIPAFFRYGPAEIYFLGRSDRHVDSSIYLLGCDCGEVGCWPLRAAVSVDADTVTWSGFQQPYREKRDYSDFGPFVFARPQYEKAVRELAEAGWDTP